MVYPCLRIHENGGKAVPDRDAVGIRCHNRLRHPAAVHPLRGVDRADVDGGSEALVGGGTELQRQAPAEDVQYDRPASARQSEGLGRSRSLGAFMVGGLVGDATRPPGGHQVHNDLAVQLGNCGFECLATR